MFNNYMQIKTQQKKKSNIFLNAKKWMNGANCLWV